MVSYRTLFHSRWWNNILIRKWRLGQPGWFPFSPALSCLLPYTAEKKRVLGGGELTCLSDSLPCSRIIFLELTACCLSDIFTKSDLACDLNAKWTLQGLRILSPPTSTSPLTVAWQCKDEWALGKGPCQPRHVSQWVKWYLEMAEVSYAFFMSMCLWLAADLLSR